MRFLRDCYRCGESHDIDDEPEECDFCGAPWPTGEPVTASPEQQTPESK